MKPYSEYTAEELAMERLFIRWVRNPDDPPIQRFWENWIEQNPMMVGTVESARELVDVASGWEVDSLPPNEAGSLWDRIRSSIETLPEIEYLDPSVKAIAANWYFLRWSAGIVATVLLVMLWFFWEPEAFPRPQTVMAKSDTTRVIHNQDSTKKSSIVKLK